MRLKQHRYVPKLPDFLTLCERNYAQLSRLLPQQPLSGQHWLINISELHQYRMQVIDNARFTTTLLIELVNGRGRFFRPWFEVRLYHDAQLAEVVACQQLRHFRAVYEYPNLAMRLPDEKYQINTLLQDWLKLCAAQGYSATEQVFS
ncbi:DUF1249 domain-containing protein [Chromatiaceae bacterium AAb-1]|nr:DUF1249 domain-containing protein [Chromatiaceae bacterium AAb-1]